MKKYYKNLARIDIYLFIYFVCFLVFIEYGFTSLSALIVAGVLIFIGEFIIGKVIKMGEIKCPVKNLK